MECQHKKEVTQGAPGSLQEWEAEMSLKEEGQEHKPAEL